MRIDVRFLKRPRVHYAYRGHFIMQRKKPMNWAREFYSKQNQWSGVYENGPLPPHRQARWRSGLGAAQVAARGAAG